MVYVYRYVGGLALVLLLVLGLGCAGDETGIPASVLDQQAATPVVEQQAATPAQPQGGGGNALDDISVFPSFMPALGFSTDTSDCQLTDDPYSACI
ncbi:MAG: hypothetical protein WBP10_04625 [Thermoanaerobaculia bacterium]|jgi:hypothetical protein